MQRFKIKKYTPKHPSLKGLVIYFWAMECDFHARLHHKLLPVSNIDIVLNLSSPMTYVSGEKVEQTPKFSISGIRSRYCDLHQEGRLKTLGVSFFPAGLYPLLKTPLSEYANQMLKMDYADFTSMAYDHDYYDQAHLIKDFRAFTGTSPRMFLKEKKSIKQIMNK